MPVYLTFTGEDSWDLVHGQSVLFLNIFDYGSYVLSSAICKSLSILDPAQRTTKYLVFLSLSKK